MNIKLAISILWNLAFIVTISTIAYLSMPTAHPILLGFLTGVGYNVINNLIQARKNRE